MGIAGMVQTTRNLARLSAAPARVEPVFAGEAARFRLILDNAADFDRPEILLRQMDSAAQCRSTSARTRQPTPNWQCRPQRRGWLPLGRVMLETRFPIGLFRAWSYVRPDSRCLVYRGPSRRIAAARAQQPGRRRTRARAGQRRFLRPARLPAGRFAAPRGLGSPRRAADALLSRSDDMLTKQFAGEAVAELWLNLAELPVSLGLEARLSRLAGWVLAAERGGAHYGLRLGATELAPGRGDSHRAACLEALALYQGA
jgi:uncharacterized protein (DUF58 family)